MEALFIIVASLGVALVLWAMSLQRRLASLVADLELLISTGPARGALALQAPLRPRAEITYAPTEKPGLHRARPRDIRDAERVHELLAFELEISGIDRPPSQLRE